MFIYPIHKSYSRTKFAEACNTIEMQLEGLHKEPSLEDVDCTQIQMYVYQGKKIRLLNDSFVDAVYAESTLNLNGVFGTGINGIEEQYPAQF